MSIKTVLGGALAVAVLAVSLPLYAQQPGSSYAPSAVPEMPSGGGSMPSSHDGPPPPDSRMTQPGQMMPASPPQGGAMPLGSSHPGLPPKGVNGPQNMMMPPGAPPPRPPSGNGTP